MRLVCDTIAEKRKVPETNQMATLAVGESNALIEGLQKLFNESSDDEQIRLLTVALPSQGRVPS